MLIFTPLYHDFTILISVNQEKEFQREFYGISYFATFLLGCVVISFKLYHKTQHQDHNQLAETRKLYLFQCSVCRIDYEICKRV